MTKTAIVTGASRGLGMHIAQALTDQGILVLMFCRSAEAGEKARENWANAGLAEIVSCDIADTASIDAAYDAVSKRYQTIDILINCAAINIDDQTLVGTFTTELYHRTMNTNVLGVMWMCKRFLPMLRKSDDARIINFSSGLGMLSVPRMGAMPLYSISKTAVNALTVNLAEEEKAAGVCVVSVDPGWVKTDMGGPNAMLEIADGIDTPVWLATTQRSDIQSGKFYKERALLDW